MIELATGCLELAGQRVLRSQQIYTRTSRALCPSFWRHAGHEIKTSILRSLLARRRARAPFATSHTTVQQTKSTTTDDVEPIFLDFLYPTQTLEAMQQLGRPSGKPSRLRKRKPATVVLRGYSTTSVHTVSDSDDKEVYFASTERIKGSNQEHTDANDALAQLATLLGRRNGPEHNDVIWQLYNRAGRHHSTRLAVVLQLSRSTLSKDVKRADEILEGLDRSEWTAKDYRLAMSCKVKVHQWDAVIALCRECYEKTEDAQCSLFAFRKCLRRGRWQEATTIWDLMSQTDALDKHTSFKRDISSLPNLAETIIALTASAMRPPSSWFLETVKVILRHLLPLVTKDETAIRNLTTKQSKKLFSGYRDLGLLEPDDYYSTFRSLRACRTRRKFTQALLLFHDFCDTFPDVIPPVSAVEDVWDPACLYRATEAVDFITSQFARWDRAMPPGMIRQRLSVFASKGDDQKMEEIAQDLRSSGHDLRDQSFHSPLLLTYARRGDVTQTQREMERIRALSGTEPNGHCQNILLSAYCHAGDIDGASAQFRKILNLGSQDPHTFGTLMGFLAKRGDTKAVHELLELARGMHIEFTAPMTEYLVQSLCQSQELEAAERIVNEVTKSDVRGSLTRMWNKLLGAYASRGKIAEVMRLQRSMKAANVRLDNMTYANLMQCLVAVKQTQAARQVMQEMYKDGELEALPFHYAILLKGFAREKNKTMVTLIYHEMLERFSTTDPDLRMDDLERLALIDIRHLSTRANRFRRGVPDARQFLKSLLATADVQDLAGQGPDGNVRNASLREDYPLIYQELINHLHGREGTGSDLEGLLCELAGKKLTPAKKGTKIEDVTLKYLTMIMTAYFTDRRLSEVSKIFRRTIDYAMRNATETNILDGIGADAQSESTTSLLNKDKVRQESPKILWHQRYILSRPFTLYIRALALSKGLYAVGSAIQDYQSKGFALSTFNLTAYVQLLAASSRPEEQLRSFTLFEKHFMPNWPGWKLLLRGLAAGPQRKTKFALGSDERVSQVLSFREKKLLARTTDPGYMQPTYLTCTILGKVLLEVLHRSPKDGGSELHALRTSAPKTFDVLRNTPFVKDKVQGTLLRGYSPGPQLRKYPRPVQIHSQGVLSTASADTPLHHRLAADQSNYTNLLRWLELSLDRAHDGDLVLDVEDEERKLDHGGLAAMKAFGDFEILVDNSFDVLQDKAFVRAILTPTTELTYRSREKPRRVDVLRADGLVADDSLEKSNVAKTESLKARYEHDVAAEIQTEAQAGTYEYPEIEPIQATRQTWERYRGAREEQFAAQTELKKLKRLQKELRENQPDPLNETARQDLESQEARIKELEEKLRVTENIAVKNLELPQVQRPEYLSPADAFNIKHEPYRPAHMGPTIRDEIEENDWFELFSHSLEAERSQVTQVLDVLDEDRISYRVPDRNEEEDTDLFSEASVEDKSEADVEDQLDIASLHDNEAQPEDKPT